MAKELTHRADELKELGWSNEEVQRYEELWDYRQRWGAINLEREDRQFLRKAEAALPKIVIGKAVSRKPTQEKSYYRWLRFYLEEMEKAKARGAKIYAEIIGYGATSDGHDMVQPSGEGAVRCMRMSMENIGCEIDYINPHATSTPIGDEKEVEAIRETFGNKIPNISATKSLTGHSLGAAGVQEAIYSILMMQNDFIAKSANIENIDPKFEDLPINRERIDNANIGCLLSNSFGFGGTNASLVFKNPNL